MVIATLVFGSARWHGPGVGETTRATGVQLGRGLALVAAVVAVLCGWSVLSEPSTRVVALAASLVFAALTVDLATTAARPRHVLLAVVGLVLAPWVSDPTGSGGVFPGEVALPCALLTCVGVFRGVRGWAWIAVVSLVSAAAIQAAGGTATFRGPVVLLQFAMLAAAGVLASALHDVVRRTDETSEDILAELVAGEVARRERAAEETAIHVLHETVSDALLLVAHAAAAPEQTRESCAAAHVGLRAAAGWRGR